MSLRNTYALGIGVKNVYREKWLFILVAHPYIIENKVFLHYDCTGDWHAQCVIYIMGLPGNDYVGENTCFTLHSFTYIFGR